MARFCGASALFAIESKIKLGGYDCGAIGGATFVLCWVVVDACTFYIDDTLCGVAAFYQANVLGDGDFGAVTNCGIFGNFGGGNHVGKP